MRRKKLLLTCCCLWLILYNVNVFDRDIKKGGS